MRDDIHKQPISQHKHFLDCEVLVYFNHPFVPIAIR